MKSIILSSGLCVELEANQRFEQLPKMLQIVETSKGLDYVLIRWRATSVIHFSKDGHSFEPYFHAYKKVAINQSC